MDILEALLFLNGSLIGAAVGRRRTAEAFGGAFILYPLLLVAIYCLGNHGPRNDDLVSIFIFFLSFFSLPFVVIGALGSIYLASDLGADRRSTFAGSVACVVAAALAGTLGATLLFAGDLGLAALAWAYFAPQIIYVILFDVMQEHRLKVERALKAGRLVKASK